MQNKSFEDTDKTEDLCHDGTEASSYAMVMFLIILVVPSIKDLKILSLLASSASTAAITTMFAVKFKKDVGYAAGICSFHDCSGCHAAAHDLSEKNFSYNKTENPAVLSAERTMGFLYFI